MKILVSWLGSNDVRRLSECAEGQDAACAVVSILASPEFGPFDEMCLFVSRDLPLNEEEEAKRELAQERLQAICDRLQTSLCIVEAADNARAASPEKLWDFSLAALAGRYGQGKGCKFHYNITSGTALMATIQFNLSQGEGFGGHALYTLNPFWLKNEPDAIRNVYCAQMPGRLAELGAPEPTDPDLYIEPNRKIFDEIRLKVAGTDVPVLILGPSGIGKTALAYYIHKCDPKRRTKPFITKNCGALGSDSSSILSELFGHKKGAFTDAKEERKGAFIEADGGTLFLDEIGEIPYHLQSILLRVIEEGRFTPTGSDREIKANVRLIAATNRDLAKAVQEGKFREDLYYRLNKYQPRLKAVSEYSESEKAALLEQLLSSINRKSGRREPRVLSGGARDLLLVYDWPGNIREMQAALERLCLLSGEVIDADDVRSRVEMRIQSQANLSQAPAVATSGHCEESELPTDLRAWLKAWENYWIREASRHFKKQGDAAARLGLSKSRFNEKLREASKSGNRD